MFESANRMETLPFSGIRIMMEKANKMQKAGEDVIHMEIGRPDFDTPEVVKQAASESLKKGQVFYTSNYGVPELRQAIVNKLKRDNNARIYFRLFSAADITFSLLTIAPTNEVGVSEFGNTTFTSFVNVVSPVTVPPLVCKKSLTLFVVPSPNRMSSAVAPVFTNLGEVTES